MGGDSSSAREEVTVMNQGPAIRADHAIDRRHLNMGSTKSKAFANGFMP